MIGQARQTRRLVQTRSVRAVFAAAIWIAQGCAQQTPLPMPERRVAPESTTKRSSVRVPSHGLALVIHKGSRRLELYRDGSVEKAFTVVFGPKPEGRKRFQDDMRTPEGLYRVVRKKPHHRWRYFIAIDYPNPQDESAYERDREEGLIPMIDGSPMPIGSGLGIHGNDRPEAQKQGLGWTRGCVAMNNADVTELYSMVPVGTPVLFLP